MSPSDARRCRRPRSDLLLAPGDTAHGPRPGRSGLLLDGARTGTAGMRWRRRGSWLGRLGGTGLLWFLLAMLVVLAVALLWLLAIRP